MTLYSQLSAGKGTFNTSAAVANQSTRQINWLQVDPGVILQPGRNTRHNLPSMQA